MRARCIDRVGIKPPRVLLEIPNGYRPVAARIARVGRAMAQRSVGRAFQAAFAAGYRAVHFVRDDRRAGAEAFTCSNGYNRRNRCPRALETASQFA